MRSIQQTQKTSAAQGRAGIGVAKPAAQAGASATSVTGSGAANTSAGNYANEMDAARAANWKRSDGSTWWPPHDGAVPGTKETVTLPAGMVFGRIGSDRGTYVAPPGTPPEQLSLCPGTDTSVYSEYRIVKEIPGVEKAAVAAWFDKPGGGTQYKLPDSIINLVINGFIQKI